MWWSKFGLRRGKFLLCVAVVGSVGLSRSTHAATYTTFDPSGSTTTFALSIDGGAITGWYFDSNNVSHGFLRAADGTITAFDPKESVSTQALSISKGMITGYYQDSSNLFHGFMRLPMGKSSRSTLRDQLARIPPALIRA
jgi:hypothetical protein